MDVSLVISAFIAGLLMFLAPCTLPLVPGYLGFISGVSSQDLKDPLRSGRAKRRIFLNGLFFMVGFSTVFILMGTLIGFVGASFLAPYRWWLGRIGGVFVIIFGLFMLDIFKPTFFLGGSPWRTFAIFERERTLNSLILGSAFAFGWTPCVGPILGTILLLASTSATAFQGAFMLSVFSLGLAFPFLLIAAGVDSAARYIEIFSKYFKWISAVGGLFLILLGTLLVTGNSGLLIAWGYKVFRFIEYEKLLNYL